MIATSPSLPRPRLPAFALLLCAVAAVAPVVAEAQAGNRGRGLWIGGIRACRGTVIEVRLNRDVGGGPMATIRLRPEARARLARETARSVGRAMPVRLNGRTIMAPVVREPILGGTMAISGLSAGDAEAVRVAALRAC